MNKRHSNIGYFRHNRKMQKFQNILVEMALFELVCVPSLKISQHLFYQVFLTKRFRWTPRIHLNRNSVSVLLFNLQVNEQRKLPQLLKNQLDFFGLVPFFFDAIFHHEWRYIEQYFYQKAWKGRHEALFIIAKWMFAQADVGRFA